MSPLSPVPGYPAVYHLGDTRRITVRPMVAGDEKALLDFFRRVPAEDRRYLKDDVTDASVIHRWARTLDYSRVLPLLALDGDRVVGDGTLHQGRALARKHLGEVRVVIDPEWRSQGVGRTLLSDLVEIAKAQDRALEKITFEVVADAEQAAQKAARALGFKPVAIFSSHVKYFDGQPHDLIVLELEVNAPPPSRGEPEEAFDF